MLLRAHGFIAGQSNSYSASSGKIGHFKVLEHFFMRWKVPVHDRTHQLQTTDFPFWALVLRAKGCQLSQNMSHIQAQQGQWKIGLCLLGRTRGTPMEAALSNEILNYLNFGSVPAGLLFSKPGKTNQKSLTWNFFFTPLPNPERTIQGPNSLRLFTWPTGNGQRMGKKL